ncbi:MAG: response regulator [Chthonomonadales bacterium]|nr:response regulator [Chthonomonadales bacterium]
MARILVVDDEEDVRAALRRRLEREGYGVETAACAGEAARALQQGADSFDLVVTDMSMEEADSGLAVLRDAVARDVFTEVIVLTAYGNVTNAVESMRRGAFDYLEKNVPGLDSYEVLVLKIGQAMERRRAAVNTVRRLEESVRHEE